MVSSASAFFQSSIDEETRTQTCLGTAGDGLLEPPKHIHNFFAIFPKHAGFDTSIPVHRVLLRVPPRYGASRSDPSLEAQLLVVGFQQDGLNCLMVQLRLFNLVGQCLQFLGRG